MRVSRRVAPLLVALLGLLLAAPGGALAAAPLQNRQQFVDDGYFQACGLDLHGHSEGHLSETTWVADATDANGQPIVTRHVFREQGTGYYEANGKSLAFSFAHVYQDSDIVYNGPATVTLDDGTVVTGASYSFHTSIQGAAILLRVPGGRVVSVTAGRVDVDQTIVIFSDGGSITIAGEETAVHGPRPFDGAGACALLTKYLS